SSSRYKVCMCVCVCPRTCACSSFSNFYLLFLFPIGEDVEDDFAKKIKALHREGGTQWLLILNEMQPDDKLESSRTPSRSIIGHYTGFYFSSLLDYFFFLCFLLSSFLVSSLFVIGAGPNSFFFS